DPNHEFEVRIDLPLGSYAAKFHAAPEKPSPPESPSPVTVEVPASPQPSPVRLTKPALRVAIIAGIAAAAIGLTWAKVATSRTALDRLWGPVLESQSPALLCVGQRPFVGLAPAEPKSALPPGQNSISQETSLFQLYYLGSQNAAMPDVLTMGM